jgi:hypothetical protein
MWWCVFTCESFSFVRSRRPGSDSIEARNYSCAEPVTLHSESRKATSSSSPRGIISPSLSDKRICVTSSAQSRLKVRVHRCSQAISSASVEADHLLVERVKNSQPTPLRNNEQGTLAVSFDPVRIPHVPCKPADRSVLGPNDDVFFTRQPLKRFLVHERRAR